MVSLKWKAKYGKLFVRSQGTVDGPQINRWDESTWPKKKLANASPADPKVGEAGLSVSSLLKEAFPAKPPTDRVLKALYF